MHNSWRQHRLTTYFLKHYYPPLLHGRSLPSQTWKDPVGSLLLRSLFTNVNISCSQSYKSHEFISSRAIYTTPPHRCQFQSRLASTKAKLTMDRGHATTPQKRRTSPPASLERPNKQLKPPGPVYLSGNNTPNHVQPESNGRYLHNSDDGSDEKITPIVPIAAENAEWQATIERVVRNVVSIHFCQTCSFDTDTACSSEATGFVVDAEKGYILTNRHVVCAGPFWGFCVFDNHEEVGATICLNNLY